MHIHTLVAGNTRVSVVPARGALVSALEVDGRRLLYLDAATLADTSKNVRGGIPILFPFAGRLAGDRFDAAGTTIKQHGFGRNRAWQVVAETPASLLMCLRADDETRAQFPFDFQAELRVEALPDGVHLALETTNLGTVPLPLSPGWHPYFEVACEAKGDLASEVPGLARGALNDERELDFGLVAPADGVTRLAPLGIELAAAPSMRHLQVWTLPGRAFVCVEPFWGPSNTLNTADRAEVAPGEKLVVWMRVTRLSGTQARPSGLAPHPP